MEVELLTLELDDVEVEVELLRLRGLKNISRVSVANK